MNRIVGALLVGGAFVFVGVAAFLGCSAHDSPAFTLRREHDSLYWLNGWRLPYPVYRFTAGDVDGDGTAEALVGVVKATRFHPEEARRLWVFHLVNGKARPLWLGSRLGAPLVDFRFTDGRIRTLEQTARDRYRVVDYRWHDFGPGFERFVIEDTDQDNALKHFDL